MSSCLTLRDIQAYAVLVIFCLMGTAPVVAHTETQINSDVYLWAGHQLFELSGPNADRVRAAYLPVLKSYPNLRSCERRSTTDSADHLTRTNLQALPTLEAAEVCLFYEIASKKSESATIAALSSLGFKYLETMQLGNRTRIRFVWNDQLGPLVKQSLIGSLISGMTTAGVALDLDFSPGFALHHLRLSPISKIQF